MPSSRAGPGKLASGALLDRGVELRLTQKRVALTAQHGISRGSVDRVADRLEGVVPQAEFGVGVDAALAQLELLGRSDAADVAAFVAAGATDEDVVFLTNPAISPSFTITKTAPGT